MLEFFSHLNRIHPLSAEAQAALLKTIRAKELRKGQVWLQEGAECDRICFVLRGLLKLYFEEGNREVILYFADVEDWMVSAQSYFGRVPSKFAIRTVEHSVVVYLMREELDGLTGRFPELRVPFVKIAQTQTMALETHTGLLLLGARRRFEVFSRSKLAKRLSDKMIAGYLGVTQNSVCNWRKTMDLP